MRGISVPALAVGSLRVALLAFPRHNSEAVQHPQGLRFEFVQVLIAAERGGLSFDRQRGEREVAKPTKQFP
jgi:hypothetical protein